MYLVVIVPMPATTAAVQALINASVPAGSTLISTSVYSDGGALQIMIVYK
ncbi:MAG TPA: hypothetical protein VGO59_20550 [Verrucomicrobiae bacterium]|jgi:hypothetical protein